MNDSRRGYERQQVSEHRHIVLLPKNDNSHMLKWKSFEWILIACNCHDEWWPTVTLRCKILTDLTN